MNSPFVRARRSFARQVYVVGSAVAGVVLSVSVAAAAEGYLGIYMQEVTESLRRGMDLPRGAGVLVSDVQEDSPADKAGLHEGDVITEVDGHTVGSPDDIRRAVSEAGAGRTVDLTVWRDGDERTVSVKLGSRDDRDAEQEPRTRIMRVPGNDNDNDDESDEGAPRREIRIHRDHDGDDDDDDATPPAPPTPRDARPGRPGLRGGYLGVGLADLTPQLGAYFGVRGGGVLVTSVEDDSPADDGGLKAGDVIVGVGDDDVNSASDLRQAVRGRKPGTMVRVRVMRDRSTTTLDVKLGTAPRSVSMLGQPMDMVHMNEMLQGMQGLEGLKGLDGLKGFEGFENLHRDYTRKWEEKSGKKGEPRIYVLPRKDMQREGGDADLHQELDRLRSRIDDLQKQIDEEEKGQSDHDEDDDE